MSFLDKFKAHDAQHFDDIRSYDCPMLGERFFFRAGTLHDDSVANNPKNFKGQYEPLAATYFVLLVDKDGNQVVRGVPRLKEQVKEAMGSPTFRKHVVNALKAIGEIDTKSKDVDDDSIVDADQEGTTESAKKPSSRTPDESI